MSNYVLKLTEEEKTLLHKVLSYQMVDVAFMDSFKGSRYGAEKRALDRLMEKLQKLNGL